MHVIQDASTLLLERRSRSTASLRAAPARRCRNRGPGARPAQTCREATTRGRAHGRGVHLLHYGWVSRGRSVFLTICRFPTCSCVSRVRDGKPLALPVRGFFVLAGRRASQRSRPQNAQRQQQAWHLDARRRSDHHQIHRPGAPPILPDVPERGRRAPLPTTATSMPSIA